MAALFPEIDGDDVESGEEASCEVCEGTEGEGIAQDEHRDQPMYISDPENDSDCQITAMVCNCDKCMAARMQVEEEAVPGEEKASAKARVPNPASGGQRKKTVVAKEVVKVARRLRLRTKLPAALLEAPVKGKEKSAGKLKSPMKKKKKAGKGILPRIEAILDGKNEQQDLSQPPTTPIICPVTVTRRMKGDKYVSAYLMHGEANSDRRVYLCGTSLKQSHRFMELIQDCAMRANNGELTTKSHAKAYLDIGARIPEKEAAKST